MLSEKTIKHLTKAEDYINKAKHAEGTYSHVKIIHSIGQAIYHLYKAKEIEYATE